jgi:hypothetical protein
MDIEFGNAGELDTHGTGWFVGFSDWAQDGKANLRHMPTDMAVTGLCAKWYLHPADHPNGEGKPISEGRTLSLLAGPPGAFKFEFSPSPTFEPNTTEAYVLRRTGDFLAWGAGIYHRSFGLEPSCILTLRWMPSGHSA